MGWWLLRLSAKVGLGSFTAIGFFFIRYVKKKEKSLKSIFFCFKELNTNNKPLFFCFVSLEQNEGLIII